MHWDLVNNQTEDYHLIAIKNNNNKGGGKSLPLMNVVKLARLEKSGRLLSFA